MLQSDSSPAPTRRKFVEVSALAIGASAYAAGNDIIRVGVIGCGGRGTEAARNAMRADKGARLVAMADLILARAQEASNSLRVQFPEQVVLDEEHCFGGFDGYKHVIESSDLVIIANAAKFHPLHLRAAIDAGKHVFAEKPHAVDPAGVKAVRAACELAARKKLCVMSGLHSRWHTGYQEAIQRVHDGAIGEIISLEENFLREPYVLYQRKPGLTEVEWQGSNQYHFHWLSGDDVPQSLIHNFDRARWALREQVPLKAHGMGGRSTLHGEIYGDVFDHNALVYEFASGVRLYAFTRTIPGCYNEDSSIILGSKGQCNVKAMRITGPNAWQYTGPKLNPYDLEHEALFRALRAGEVINNGDYMAKSTLMAVMGQISCYTGKEITWEQISASEFFYPPKPEEVSANMTPPVNPDAEGIYPVFVPGVTKLL